MYVDECVRTGVGLFVEHEMLYTAHEKNLMRHNENENRIRF